MAEQTIDKLQIEIEASAGSSVTNIDKLAKSLENLKSVTSSGSDGLSKFATSMDKLKTVAEGLKGKSSILTSMSKSLNALSAVKFPATDELKNFAESFEGFGGAVEEMREFKSGVGSLKTAFKNLDKINFDGMSDRIKRLVDAIKPLTDEMIRGGQGASNFGTQMQALVSAAKATNAIQTKAGGNKTSYQSHKANAQSWNWEKIKTAYNFAKKTANVIGDFVGEINDYIEDLNLFTVAMGDYAEQGMAYANKMQSVLGVNAGEAMRYMGVFQQMGTSMGFTQERAYTLSQTLTQLGYDWSSYYNLGTEESFTKLQSAIAGETEPVRRLGIDISSARLQQELYNLGIHKSVEELSQADKATLRYIALLKQSQNAMGDLSRSIDSPSNALRMLNAQWEVAKREIGSVFIPMLIKILPPAIAVVRVLGDIARSIANLFGFELPKIDYSGVGNLSTGLSDAAGSAEDLTGNLKETKKEISGLLGFDEINALSETESSSGGGSGASGGYDASSVLGDIELPTYDMFSEVENSVDKWVDKFKDGFEKIKSFIEPFTPLLKGLGVLIGSTLAFNWVTGALKKAKGLSWFTGFLDLAKRGLKWYSAEFKKTHNIWTAAGNGIKNLQGKISKLPTATKAVAGLATVAAEIVVVKSAMDKFYDGTLSWKGALAEISVAAGVAGGILYGLFGPAGLLVAAAGVVAGLVASNLEYCRKLEEAAFYAETGGTKISDVAAKYTLWSDEIVKANQKLIENHAEIENSQGKIKDLTGEIQTLNKQYEIGAISAQEYLPQVTAQINSLHDETEGTLLKIKQNLYLAISGSVGQALGELGVNLPELVAAIDKAVSLSKSTLDESAARLSEYASQLSNLKVGTSEYNEVNEKFYSELEKISSLAGVSSEQELTKLENTISSISQSLDFESPESFKRSMEEISSASETAKNSIRDSFNTSISELEILRTNAYNAGDTTLVAVFDGAIAGLKKQSVEFEQDVNGMMQETGELIQNQFSQHLIETAEKSTPSWWDRFCSVISGVGVEKMKTRRIGYDLAEPISSDFENAFGKNMNEAVDSIYTDLLSGSTNEEIMSKLKDSSDTLSTNISNWFGNDLYTAAENATGEFENGLTSETSEASVSTGMKMVSDTLVSEFVRNQGLDSDSSVMSGLGGQTVMSLSMGMGTKQSELEVTANSLSTSILNGVSSLPTDMQTNGQNITNGFLSGLSGLNRDTDSKLSLLSGKFSGWSATLKTPHLSWDMNGLQTSGILKNILETLNLPTTLPKLSVSWYAKGGIFNSPRIIGVGESGPEAVVPLSENAEWIESLAAKIAQRGAQLANFAIPERYDNSNGGDWTFILQRADGTTEGEVTITAVDRMNQSHGEMKIPLYV